MTEPDHSQVSPLDEPLPLGLWSGPAGEAHEPRQDAGPGNPERGGGAARSAEVAESSARIDVDAADRGETAAGGWQLPELPPPSRARRRSAAAAVDEPAQPEAAGEAVSAGWKLPELPPPSGWRRGSAAEAVDESAESGAAGEAAAGGWQLPELPPPSGSDRGSAAAAVDRSAAMEAADEATATEQSTGFGVPLEATPQPSLEAAEPGPRDEPADVVDCPFNVGDRVGGHYLLLELLQRRPDGVRFAAFDSNLARRVELKIWHGGGSCFGVTREAQLAARIDHPAFGRCLDVGSVGGLPYLVTERAPGTPIAELAALGAVFEPDRALRITHRIALALRHAVRRGLPQAMLDPQGVRLSGDGDVHLVDRDLERIAPDVAFARVVPQLGALLATLVGARCPAPIATLIREFADCSELNDYTAVIASLELTARECFGIDAASWREAPPSASGAEGAPADGSGQRQVVARFRAN